MNPLYEKADKLTKEVIDAAIRVHEHFGPGLLESIYAKCLEQELKLAGHQTKREETVWIKYRGLEFDEKLRIDLLVDDCLIVECKAVEVNNPMLFKMQTLSYMKLMNLPLGLAINFGGTTLKGKNIWRVILKGADLPE